LPPDAEIEGVNIGKAMIEGTPIKERTLYWRTPKQFALRKRDWKLVYTGTMDEGTYELFNLANDPNETQDVARENNEIVMAMLEELKKQIELDIIL